MIFVVNKKKFISFTLSIGVASSGSYFPSSRDSLQISQFLLPEVGFNNQFNKARHFRKAEVPFLPKLSKIQGFSNFCLFAYNFSKSQISRIPLNHYFVFN